ncbi:hypothetical protein EIP91_007632 [Steccherinum ochraceum]|uniref:JmjC domain-containing protein n=1 Tax=Steccherinum ochraceum TaxID=92696 RepID=A0A4R0R440_9APHY|nr:hypothetical protein EIP91_007632 [Steccherinum ochraceum]
MGYEGCTKISHAPSYAEFLEEYLIPNMPVIIGPALVTSWPAFSTWTVPSKSGTDGKEDDPTTREIHWQYLVDRYGHFEVSVADCASVDVDGNQERDTRLFRDVVSLWQNGEGRTLYVKDWHLPNAVETEDPGKAFYTTPDIFRDDWMNAYYSAYTGDDFRFVYVGASGTFTPLHRDVYTSYSWSTNICGRKRWWLFDPQTTDVRHLAHVHRPSLLAYDVRHADPVKFPHLANVKAMVVDQKAGETIFV